MTDELSKLNERVYMVNADDEYGDHHIFVSMDLGRAEARYEIALQTFRRVEANWMKEREQ